MEPTAFDDLTAIYDAMIDWPRRLAHEGPFFQRRFAQIGARRVADVACGTGRHAALFVSWGLEVQGSDISGAMLARARALHPDVPVQWALRSFAQPLAPDGSYDGLVCVGNSLALVADEAAALQAVGHMLAAVRSGGIVIVHVLNLWRLADGPVLWQKSLRRTLPTGDALIVKGVHRCGDRGYVDLLVLAAETGERRRAESVPFVGLRAVPLTAAATRAGARTVELFGNHADEPYVADSSTDLILVAQKA